MNLSERLQELMEDASIKRISILKGPELNVLSYKRYKNGGIIMKKEVFNKDLEMINKPIKKLD